MKKNIDSLYSGIFRYKKNKFIKHQIVCIALFFIVIKITLANQLLEENDISAMLYEGTIVITHGWQPEILKNEVVEKKVGWSVEMAEAIAKLANKKNIDVRIFRAGNGTIKKLSEKKSLFSKNKGGISNQAFLDVLIFDWVNESALACQGYSEAAGDALFAYLIEGAINPEINWSLNNLHFIGHSRGTIVNSEALQRLIYIAGRNLLPETSFPLCVDDAIHITTLDPHPVGHWWADLYDDDEVNKFDVEVQCGTKFQKKCGVVGWKYDEYKIGYIDNYWQQNYYNFNFSLDNAADADRNDAKGKKFFLGLSYYPGVKLQAGSTNLSFTDNASDHSAVTTWYINTIHQNSKESRGFKYSKLKAPPEKLRNLIKTEESELINIEKDLSFNSNFHFFNGDFSKRCDLNIKNLFSNQIPGWSFQGGGGKGHFKLGGILELDKNDETRTHNISYFPTNAKNLLLSYRHTRGSGFLKIYFISNGQEKLIETISLGKLPLGALGTNVGYAKINLFDKKISGKTGKLKFLIDNNDKGIWPNVEITKIEIETDKYFENIVEHDCFSKSNVYFASALIIDRSGSMKDTVTNPDGTKAQKLESAKEAAKAFILTLDDTSGTAISTFSDTGTTELPMSLVTNIDQTIDQTLAKIVSAGATNIGDGLDKGFMELKNAESPVHTALLLSDGMNNRGKLWTAVQKYEDNGWPICTIGFGNDADEETLRKIATITGCAYAAAQSFDIVSRYQALAAYAKNNSITLTASDLLAIKGKLIYEFVVSQGAGVGNVHTNWQGSMLKTVLLSPDGTRIEGTGISPNQGRYVEGRTFQMLEIKNPVPGKWRVELSWKDAPPSPEQVNILVTEKTDVFARIHGLKSQYSLGQTVDINTDAFEVVNNRKIPLNNATVKIHVKKPGEEVIRLIQAQSTSWTMYKDVLADLRRDVSMFDDGAHSDYRSSDGIFGGSFSETDKNGVYVITAAINGLKQNGETVEKTIISTFQVGSIMNNPVSSSQTLNFISKVEQQIDNTAPISTDLLQQPLEEIENLQQGGDPLDEINQLLQQ